MIRELLEKKTKLALLLQDLPRDDPSTASLVLATLRDKLIGNGAVSKTRDGFDKRKLQSPWWESGFPCQAISNVM